MKLSPEHIKLLGLSRKEIAVLDALRAGSSTPLAISKDTGVSRPAVYEILTRLKNRGIAKKTVKNGKAFWILAKRRDLDGEIYEMKRQLFSINEGIEEIHGASDSTVIVHRGGTAIRALLLSIFRDHKEQKLYGIQGDVVAIGWNKVFGIEGTNEINGWIKKNRIIVEGIIPHGWLERQVKLLGKKWADDFMGRAAITHEIDGSYFNHGGQVFIFKNSLYLIAMNEEIIIEVRNSEIQKLILSLFRFMQDNSKKIDVNDILRNCAEKTD